ncbi:hypothetical protein M011DRAFT_489868 [Sporormia fimetaria CBS 119925]|uniref:Heterokaryon incompatibility domain-containing protein n=1 Tax=Sporormia fimetaria CBS 119925 TaxID=1340428 RepID=A0A6A6UYH2_9PLEO|nr:hypothetical protein M011DRAFT_489868 [Sporormia fimetaria CBS 119925]
MTRWHNASCTTPDVFLDSNNWPICKACSQSCPLLEELQDQELENFSVLTVPADEAPVQLGLWWPSTVTYETPDGQKPTRPLQADTSEVAEASSTVSPIYGDTLKSAEFRLACLEPVDDDDYPMHLNLEIYTHDNRPEYETASYLWGGEEGDYSSSHPVFIGSFWDVSLQTKNCWSMLRFARPRRGIRMLVMVYLGNDIVTPSAPFPSYRLLNELTENPPRFPDDHPFSKEQFTLEKLLQRKYFSRVWMIQELVYSERAVFRVGNVDYRADGHIMSSSQLDVATVPWFRRLGRGKHGLTDISTMLDLLHLTSKSHASDTWDKIFGVIGLLGNRHRTLLSQITPDYSISHQQCCIGIAAHILLVETQLNILYNAKTLCGVLGSSSSDNKFSASGLSWLPTFGSRNPLPDILDSSNLPSHALIPREQGTDN